MYVCMYVRMYVFRILLGHSKIMDVSVVREKTLEQVQNNKQPFPSTLFMTDRC